MPPYARTETFPQERRLYHTAPDLVTALRVMGTGIELPMLAAQSWFTLGRGETCTLRVDRKHLAGVHVRIERIDGTRGAVRVTNISNGKNDLVRKGEVAEREFEMGPGDWFAIGDSRYYALNEEMRLLREQVMAVLGVGAHQAIDELLIASIADSSRHCVLIGEQGCDQNRLGRIIHQVSYRRHNRFEPLPARPRLDAPTRALLGEIRGGTLFVDLHQRGKLDPSLAREISAADAQIRLIVSSETTGKAAASFSDQFVSGASHIKLTTLRSRKHEIPELLDQRFVWSRSGLRFSMLRPDVQVWSQAFDWPGNIEQLKAVSDTFVRIAHSQSVRDAARTLQMTRAKFRTWLLQHGLTAKHFPLIAT